jgi:predicted RNase H-like nuclease (RuvC/YqgF family)
MGSEREKIAAYHGEQAALHHDISELEAEVARLEAENEELERYRNRALSAEVSLRELKDRVDDIVIYRNRLISERGDMQAKIDELRAACAACRRAADAEAAPRQSPATEEDC